MSIKICLYSYKNKNLLNYCKDILNKSNTDVFIEVYDQNNLNRALSFKENKIVYKHIYWDDISGKWNLIQQSLNDNYDYLLIISDNIILSHGWDEEVLKNYSKGNVISGNMLGKVIINKFLVKYVGVNISNFTKTNWVDKDFIFLSKDQINLIKNPSLKDIGQDLWITLKCLSVGIDIISTPSSLYKKNELKDEYKTYSKWHGYKDFISNIKMGKINISKFNNCHGVDLNDIVEIPYKMDDVRYNSIRIMLDNENGTRFHTGLKRIFL